MDIFSGAGGSGFYVKDQSQKGLKIAEWRDQYTTWYVVFYPAGMGARHARKRMVFP